MNPVVEFLRAFFQDKEPASIAEFIEEYGREQVQCFLGGAWAVYDLIAALQEQVEDGMAEDDAEAMMAQFEAGLIEGLEVLGLEPETRLQ